jgi:hypothetical protein
MWFRRISSALFVLLVIENEKGNIEAWFLVSTPYMPSKAKKRAVLIKLDFFYVSFWLFVISFL